MLIGYHPGVGESGIGSPVSTVIARKGADVEICYLAVMEDAVAEGTRARALRVRGMRAHAAALGPARTLPILATMDEREVSFFGSQAPFGRATESDEIAPSCLLFAEGLISSPPSGEMLASIGGEMLPE